MWCCVTSSLHCDWWTWNAAGVHRQYCPRQNGHREELSYLWIRRHRIQGFCLVFFLVLGLFFHCLVGFSFTEREHQSHFGSSVIIIKHTYLPITAMLSSVKFWGTGDVLFKAFSRGRGQGCYVNNKHAVQNFFVRFPPVLSAVVAPACR